MNRFQNDIHRTPGGIRLPRDPDPIEETSGRRLIEYLTLFFCGLYPVLLFTSGGELFLRVLPVITVAFSAFLVFSLISTMHSFRSVAFPVIFLGISVLSDFGLSMLVPAVYAIIVGSAFYLFLRRSLPSSLPLLLVFAVVSYGLSWLMTGGDFGLALICLVPYLCGALMSLVERSGDSRLLVSAFGGFGIALTILGTFALWFGLSYGFSSLTELPAVLGKWEEAFLAFEESEIAAISESFDLGVTPAITDGVLETTVSVFRILPGLCGAACALLAYGAHSLSLRLDWYTGRATAADVTKRVEFFPSLTSAVIASVSLVLVLILGADTPVGNGALNLTVVFIPVFAYFGVGSLLALIAAGRSCLTALLPLALVVLFVLNPALILSLSAGFGVIATYYFRIAGFFSGRDEDDDGDGEDDEEDE